MPQAYSSPKRADDPHALPDVEYFFVSRADAAQANIDASRAECAEDDVQHWETQSGWYWWPCFPGCLPDGDPSGPFATEQECIDDFTTDDDEEDM